MAPLFDMFAQAQNGQAIELMAKQFGLAQEQMVKASAALMPAFSTAFKRNTTNPYDLGSLMTAISTGDYAKYFEDMKQAFTPQGVADGNDVLGQLFGSKEMSRAIAAQAAQMTGIGQEIYKQMLPVMASTLMGGLFKETMGQADEAFANNPMMQLMRQWMEMTGFAKKAEPHPNPFDNPFMQAMQGFFGVGKAKEEPKAPDLFADNPFVKAFQDRMRSSTEMGQKAPEPEPEQNPAFAQFSQMMNKMFDTGLEMQKEYQKNIDALFERYKSGSDDKA